MTKTRTESDSFGTIDVDASRYWGAQTQRSVELFRIGGYVAGDARITEINGPIGLMRRDLSLWIEGDGGEKG